MKQKKREVIQSSFNMLDEYERELWEWATKSEHGSHSQYVKRLIAQDRERHTSNNVVIERFAKLIDYVEPVDVNENKEAAKGFI